MSGPFIPALTLPFFLSGLFRDSPVLLAVTSPPPEALGLSPAPEALGLLSPEDLGLLSPDGALVVEGGVILDWDGARILEIFPRVNRGFGESVAEDFTAAADMVYTVDHILRREEKIISWMGVRCNKTNIQSKEIKQPNFRRLKA